MDGEIKMTVKNRPMTEAEKLQLWRIKTGLGKYANHPLVEKILVDHQDQLPRIGNCGVTVEESANYEEYCGRQKWRQFLMVLFLNLISFIMAKTAHAAFRFSCPREQFRHEDKVRSTLSESNINA
jgi:hypothetical protein